MSDENRRELDEATGHLVWHRATPLSRAELQELARYRQVGWEGRPVRTVEVAYTTEADAVRQADAVAFAGGVVTCCGRPVASGTPIRTRTDFGLE